MVGRWNGESKRRHSLTNVIISHTEKMTLLPQQDVLLI